MAGEDRNTLTDPERAIYDAFARARTAVAATTAPQRQVAQELERALRPALELREVRDVVVALLDRAGLLSVAAVWDRDMEDVPPDRVIARVERWLCLGAPELASEIIEGLGTLSHIVPADLQLRVKTVLAVDLEQRRVTYARNLAALAPVSPDLATALEGSVRGAVALRPAGAGMVELDTSGVHRMHASGGSHHEAMAEAQQLAATIDSRAGDIYIAGVTDCALPLAVVVQRPGIDAGLGTDNVVRVVERDLPRLRAWLELDDLSEALAARRLRLHGGSRFERELLAEVSQPGASKPRIVLGKDKQVHAAIERIAPQLTMYHARRIARARQLIEARAEDIRTHWEQFLRCGTPLRIILLSPRASTYARHGISGVADALGRAGHAVQILQAPDRVTPLMAADVAEAILAFEADAVFAINFTRDTVGGTPDPVAFITWDMDALGFVEPTILSGRVGAHDHLLVNMPHVAAHLGWPADRVYGYPTPFNEQVVAAAEGMSSQPEQQGEVGYISNFHEPPEEAFLKLRAAAFDLRGAGVAERLDRAMQALSGHISEVPLSRREFYVAITEGAEGPPEQYVLHRLAKEFQIRVVSPTYRLKRLCLLAEAGLDLALFGSGWERHPTLARYARGPLDGPEALARGYFSTAIQLQIMFGKALHQRLTDGAALGRCVVICRHPLDYVGHIKRVYENTGVVTRPPHMTPEEYRYLLEQWVHDLWPQRLDENERILLGMQRVGIATDEMIDPELLDEISAHSTADLLQRIGRLLSDPSARENAGVRLQQIAYTRWNASRLLAAALVEVAKHEQHATLRTEQDMQRAAS